MQVVKVHEFVMPVNMVIPGQYMSQVLRALNKHLTGKETFDLDEKIPDDDLLQEIHYSFMRTRRRDVKVSVFSDGSTKYEWV